MFISPKTLRLGFLMMIIMASSLPLFSQESEAENEKEEESAGALVISDTTEPSVTLFNTFGSDGYFNNGARTFLKSPVNNFYLEYGYFNYDGYRKHSLQYHHDLKTRFQTSPSDRTKLTVTAIYQRGAIYFPGSLTESEYKSDPYKADQRSVDRDEKKIYSGGGFNIDYTSIFGKKRNNSIDVLGYARLDAFEMVTKEYRIFNKYRVGTELIYKNKSELFDHENMLILEGKVFTQPGRIEYYENFGGIRDVNLEQLMHENSTKSKVQLSDDFSVINDKLDLIVGVGYHYDVFSINEQLIPSREETRKFNSVTPDLKLEYHFEKDFFVYASAGLAFSSPEDYQLESPYPEFLLNQQVNATTSKNLEAGFKGDLLEDTTGYISRIDVEGKLFYNNLKNEIVSYEVFGDYFFRNAAKSEHLGIDLEAEMSFLKDFQFKARYLYSGFTYKDYQALSLETDSLGNLRQIQRDFSDKTEPGIPAHVLDLGLKYDYLTIRFLDIFCGVDYLLSGKAWADDGNVTRIPSYDLFNAELGLKIKTRHFEAMLSGEVRNVFDKVYVSYINVNSANRRYFYAGAPSSFFVNFNVSYIF